MDKAELLKLLLQTLVKGAMPDIPPEVTQKLEDLYDVCQEKKIPLLASMQGLVTVCGTKEMIQANLISIFRSLEENYAKEEVRDMVKKSFEVMEQVEVKAKKVETKKETTEKSEILMEDITKLIDELDK